MLRKIGLIATVVILACLIAETSIRTGILESLENGYYDLWHQMAGKRAQPTHTTIVVIDDETLLTHRNKPLAFWSPYFARAIGVLRNAGVTVIGIDFIFDVDAGAFFNTLDIPDTEEKSRMFNAVLLEQLTQGQVILAGLLAKNTHQEWKLRTSLDEYVMLLPEQAADIGLVNLLPDTDNIVRHFPPSFYTDDTVPGLNFATLLAVRAIGLDPQSKTWTFNGAEVPRADTPFPIGFVGPPDTIPRLSLSRLLSPNALDDPEVQGLQGKVVIIAEGSTGSQDVHFTPYASAFPGKARQLMSGAEIHANIIETLLTGRFPRHIPPWIRVLILLIVITLTTLLFFSVTPWKGMGIGLVLGMFWMLPAYVLFLGNWILPIAHLQVALAVSYFATLGFRLTGEERERVRLRQIFGRFVSDDVVEHLVTTGVSPRLGGEVYQVTVLFSDIRDFTTISEILTPSEVVEMLNTYFSRVCEPILAQGGMINKFIGDAVMAVFGAPASLPDHGERAIRAALMMKQTAEEFRIWMQKRFPDKHLPEFRIGIGLHSGEALAGNIGSTRRMEYTVIGDTVNTASRLESASKDLKWSIAASAATINAARNIALIGGRDEIHVKGREQMVEVFELVGVKA